MPADALPEFLAGVQDILKRFELTGVVPDPRAHRAGPHPARWSTSTTRPTARSCGRSRRRSTRWRSRSAARSARSTAPASPARRGSSGSTARCTPVFRELKRIFDPKNLLNPGKIVGPDPSRAAWPLAARESGVRGQESGVRNRTHERDSRVCPDSRLLTPVDASAGLEGLDPRRRGRRAAPGAATAGRATAPERMCPVFRATGDGGRDPAGQGEPAPRPHRPGRRDARRGAGGRRPVRQLQDVPRRVRRHA